MQGKVTADRLNVRSRPDLKGGRIGTLSQNEIVDILGQRNNWVEIKYNGGSAFVSGDYIETLETVTFIKGRIKAAKLNISQEARN